MKKLIGTSSKIQARINICPPFGIVSVLPGPINEAIYINKNIALIGIGTPTITTEGLGPTNTVTFDRAASVISGFVIIGGIEGWPFGDGIFPEFP